ncbi:MAG: hypothetical protein K2X27_10390 [Candidatus Obscuribacterales bacterium]|nr:hypothetical protein [Candidatus Obscuribacterales bacterium]
MQMDNVNTDKKERVEDDVDAWASLSAELMSVGSSRAENELNTDLLKSKLRIVGDGISGKDSSNAGINFFRTKQSVVDQSTVNQDRKADSVNIVDGDQTVVDQSRTGRDFSKSGVNIVKGDQLFVDQSNVGRDKKNDSVNIVEGNQTFVDQSRTGRDSFNQGINMVKGEKSQSGEANKDERIAEGEKRTEDSIEAFRDVVKLLLEYEKTRESIAKGKHLESSGNMFGGLNKALLPGHEN